MINIIICDDIETELEMVYRIVRKCFEKCGTTFKISKCYNGEGVMCELEEVGTVDLAVLDVELGSQNGIEIAKKIRKVNPYCHIVFVSGYNRYYKPAFDVQPYQFIDKPVDIEKLFKTISAVMESLVGNRQVFSFTYKWKEYRIGINDILYFVCHHRVIKMCIKDGNLYEFYGSLEETEEKINCNSALFLRVHRSYLINMNYVKMFRGNYLVMQDGRTFPISSRKHKKVIEQYMTFISQN